MTKELYRGKRVDNGEWVKGDLIKSKDKCYIHPQANVFQVNNALSKLIVLHEVIPETVGQYTGLTDRYGTKIFERDIVDILIENEERGVITYNDGCFIVEADGFILTFIDHLYGTDVEVLGNMHDNPELLKGEEE